MSSKVTKNYSLKAKGVLNIDSETKNIILLVEDVGELNLADLISDMDGMNVSINIGQTTDIA